MKVAISNGQMEMDAKYKAEGRKTNWFALCPEFDDTGVVVDLVTTMIKRVEGQPDIVMLPRKVPHNSNAQGPRVRLIHS